MNPEPDVVEDLIVAVFRLNGRLIDAGDRLIADLGLTSASWQVLGALHLSPVSLPVAHVARNMGLSRQAVQRTADLLAERGLVRFETNPHHQRAKLAVLTEQGIAAVDAATERQRPWSRDMTAALKVEHIATALQVLNDIEQYLATVAGRADDNTESPEEFREENVQ